MTVLDMVIQLIFPIAAILTTRSHTAVNLGVSLVLLGMAFEFTLALERALAFSASVTGWTDVSGGKGSGVVVDRRGRVWELDSRTRLISRAACRELASNNMAAIDSAECAWVCVRRHQRSVESVSRQLASINIAPVDSAELAWVCIRGHQLGRIAACREVASIAATIVDGIGCVWECSSGAHLGAKAICSILASVAVAVVDDVERVRECTSSIRVGVEATSLQRASMTVTDDTRGIWARQGEQRVQILWVSIGILVHGPCSNLWYPDITARAIWEGGAVIVSCAGRGSTFGQ